MTQPRRDSDDENSKRGRGVGEMATKDFNRGLDRGAERHLGPGALRADQSARGGVRRLRDRRRGGGSGRGRRRRRRRRRRRGRVLDRGRRADRGRRPESAGDQGRPRGDRAGPERGQGDRRRGPEVRSKRASSATRPTNSKRNSRRPARRSSSNRARPCRAHANPSQGAKLAAGARRVLFFAVARYLSLPAHICALSTSL